MAVIASAARQSIVPSQLLLKEQNLRQKKMDCRAALAVTGSMSLALKAHPRYRARFGTLD